MATKKKQLKYKDWHLNQKYVPKEGDDNWEEYWLEEKSRCVDGFYMDDVFFPGKLYFHLNFWGVDVDHENPNGGLPLQLYERPIFRDNEWVLFREIDNAEKAKKGLVIAGSRRLSKSSCASSYMAHGMVFDKGSQNVLACLKSDDLDATSSKIQKGIFNLPDEWKWPLIHRDWKKKVTLGVEDKKGNQDIFSTMLFRNLNDGKATEAVAGLKPRKLFIDEAAKSDFAQALQAAIPAFNTPFGWTCSPLVAFTGGDMDNFQDAQKLFMEPGALNFMEYQDPDNPERFTGLFMGAEYRMEAKYETTLDKYLGIEGKELSKIKILVSDKEKAFRITDEILEMRKKSNDSTAYIKEKMYYPKTIDEIFLNVQKSIYNSDLINTQIMRLDINKIRPSYVELYQDTDGVIKHKKSEKQPIKNFPLKPMDNKDAPIEIWEFPVENPPFGLYCGSADSYRQGQAEYSESLGCVYIYKRMNNVMGGHFQNMLVASYTARPEDKSTWDLQARLLIKYYNAITLVENDEISFIQYMLDKNEGHYLADEPVFVKEVTNRKKDGLRKKGISRASQTIRDYLNTAYKMYMEEEIVKEKDEEGNVTRSVMGISRILDKMLLEETKAYGTRNTDRVVAMQLAIALSMSLDPIIGAINGEDDPRLKAYFNRAETKGGSKLFSGGTLFNRKRSIGIFR